MRTTGHTILVVDDDRNTTEMIRLRLQSDGFQVVMAHTGTECLDITRRCSHIDLIVLDLMMPEIDGLDVCHVLRNERDTRIPLIMLTALSTEEDLLTGLQIGADDYITKPFSPRELSARISTVLRRTNQDVAQVLSWQDLTLDKNEPRVQRGNTSILLTRTETALLSVFMSEPGRTFTRDQLLARAFDQSYEGLERTIDVHISNLRRKLETSPGQPRYIRTTFGIGYRLGDRSESL